MTTIVTLAIEAASQAAFDRLRRTYYPPHLNRIAAHLTLFHALPDTDEVRDVLHEAATASAQFTMQVSHVMNLGRGVAYGLESSTLLALHAHLANAFNAHLIPQDKQRFRPHIVVQNKAGGAETKALLAKLTAEFRPWEIRADGIEWWNYLNGPWQIREHFSFAG